MDKYVIRKRPSDRPEAGEGAKKPAGTGHNTASEDNNSNLYTEKKGDLFSCGKGESLAHCISVDCHMGKGIAALFKSKFGGIQELKEQGPKVGGVAVLQRDGRYIYYLITKERYFHKPTYDSLRASLEAMKEHCVDRNVSAISMPKIGCGLDRLQWPKVSAILKELFEDTGIKITVYYL